MKQVRRAVASLFVPLALAVAAAVGGCAHTRPAAEDPLAPRASPAPLITAGARCRDGRCTCRGATPDGGGGGILEEGVIAVGQKRFELRLGRGIDPLSVTVDGRGTLARFFDEDAPVCGYLDLPPGRHHVHITAHAADTLRGMAPEVTIAELGAKTVDWYDTFQLRCGGSEPCTRAAMEDFMKEVRATPRGLRDPCGSTRFEAVSFTSHRSGVYLGDLEVDLVLHVYRFAPRFRHGAATCRGVGDDEEEEP